MNLSNIQCWTLYSIALSALREILKVLHPRLMLIRLCVALEQGSCMTLPVPWPDIASSINLWLVSHWILFLWQLVSFGSYTDSNLTVISPVASNILKMNTGITASQPPSAQIIPPIWGPAALKAKLCKNVFQTTEISELHGGLKSG